MIENAKIMIQEMLDEKVIVVKATTSVVHPVYKRCNREAHLPFKDAVPISLVATEYTSSTRFISYCSE